MLSEERMKVCRKITDVERKNRASYVCHKPTFKVHVLVRNEQQLLSCVQNMVDSIYVVDYSLYCKYKDKYSNLFYRTSRVHDCKMDFHNEKLLVCELGGVSKYSGNNFVVSDYYLNVANGDSIDYLKELGAKRVTLSVELSDWEISNIMKCCFSEVEFMIYGRVELMVMKYCPVKEFFSSCRSDKGSCHSYALKSQDQKKYPIIPGNCYTSVMHCENMDKISRLRSYMDMGIWNYRIELFDEGALEVERILKRVDSFFE